MYRLITRKSFESEMFERASRKLGLEQAVLGGHNFRDDGMGDEGMAMSDKPSNKEMEQLLRQGAYALLDENDDDAREFCEDDIEKIMQERTHRIVLDAPGKSASWLTKKGGAFKKRAFTSAEGSKAADVDVNDPDFWAKVMPDLKTPETLERRFLALAQEAQEAEQQEAAEAQQQEAAEAAEASASAAEVTEGGEGGEGAEQQQGAEQQEQQEPPPPPGLSEEAEAAAAAAATVATAPEKKQSESVRAFYQDLEDMVTKLIDLHDRGKCPTRDRDLCVMLLFKISIKEDLFSAEQKAQVAKWRSLLEGTRMRTCRQDLGVESDDDTSVDGGGRGGGGGGGKKKGGKRGSTAGAGAGAGAAVGTSKEPDAHSDVCMVCFDGGELLLCDGQCRRAFHPKCVQLESAPKDAEWLCDDCKFGNMLCLVCGEAGVVNEEVVKCKKPTCGRFYHTKCLQSGDLDPLVRWFKSQQDRFVCPQHICAGCLERPGNKPDRENFFLQCVKCPTALHLRCAVHKPVRVLTHRSMFCDKHAAETAAAPLELAAVAHIKFPERRGAKPGPKPKPKLVPVDADSDDEGKSAKDQARRGRPSKTRDGEAEGEVGGAGGGGEKKKRERKRGKLPLSQYVSELAGPFRGDTFRLTFKALEDEEEGKEAEEKKRKKKEEEESADAGSAEEGGAGAAAGKPKDEEYCPCGKADTEKEDYIQCERCAIWCVCGSAL